MIRKILATVATILWATGALAQSFSGQLPPNTLLGNPTGSAANPTVYPIFSSNNPTWSGFNAFSAVGNITPAATTTYALGTQSNIFTNIYALNGTFANVGWVSRISTFNLYQVFPAGVIGIGNSSSSNPVGVSGVAIASDNTMNLPVGTVGLNGWSLCDKVGAFECWGGYAEVRQFSGNTSFALGHEIDTTVLTGFDSPSTNPQNYAPSGMTSGIWLASGGQCGSISCPGPTGFSASSFTGSIANTGVLTVTAVGSGGLSPGQTIIGAGVTGSPAITSQLTGTTGGTGTYQLSPTGITAGSEAMTSRMNPHNVSQAIGIVDNTAFYLAAINVKLTALAGADGTDGGGTAAKLIMAGRGQGIYWFNSDGVSRFNINMTTTTAGVSGALVYSNTGLALQGSLPFSATGIISNSYIAPATLTFGTLPSPFAGMVAYISDALAANCGDASCNTWGTTVTGGTGALKRLLLYNGTNWTLAGK